MNLIFKLNLCLVLLFFITGLKGQADFRPGYVITDQNDSLSGLIDYRVAVKNENKCEFRKQARSETQVFLPADIKRFRFTEGKYFISKEVPVNGEKVALFLEFLVDGTVDLYSFNNGVNPRFFIQKSGGEIFELLVGKESVKGGSSTISRETYEYMNTLKSVMNDSPQFFPAIDKTAFDTQSLMMLVKRYDNYVSSRKAVFYEKQPPDVKLRVAPFYSFNSSLLEFNQSPIYGAIDFQRSNYSSFGLLLDASLPKSNNFLSFQFSAELGKNNFYGNGINPINPLIFEEVYFQTVNLKGKLGIKFTYPKGIFRPNLLIGGDMIYLLKRDGRRVEDITQGSTIVINEKNENIMAKNQYGYDIELGVDCHLSSPVIPFLSIGFSSLTGNNKDQEARLLVNGDKPLTTIFKTFNINAGIYF